MPEPLFKPSQASNASRTILINNCDSPSPSQVISTPSSFHWRLPSLLTPNLLYRAPRTAESTSGTLRTVRKFVFLTETIKTPCSVFRFVARLPVLGIILLTISPRHISETYYRISRDNILNEIYQLKRKLNYWYWPI